MSASEDDRTASLMTPARLAQLQVRPKPAASPAAWLDQLATDAGSGHLRRLVDLRQQFASQLAEWDHAAAESALEALAAALPRLDYTLVEPKGWLARATRKGKDAGAAFAGQFDRIAGAGEDLVDEARGLQKKQAAGAAAERSAAEIEVEVRALEKIMEQGTRWLQDMRNQLKAREAAGGDEAALQQIGADNARCEMLVARLKLLRAVNSAAQQALEHWKSLAARRAAFVQGLQRLQEGEWQAWQGKVAPVAEEARAAGSAAAGTAAAAKSQQELQSRLQSLAREGASLRTQQQALLADLSALGEAVQAAA